MLKLQLLIKGPLCYKSGKATITHNWGRYGVSESVELMTAIPLCYRPSSGSGEIMVLSVESYSAQQHLSFRDIAVDSVQNPQLNKFFHHYGLILKNGPVRFRARCIFGLHRLWAVASNGSISVSGSSRGWPRPSVLPVQWQTFNGKPGS